MYYMVRWTCTSSSFSERKHKERISTVISQATNCRGLRFSLLPHHLNFLFSIPQCRRVLLYAVLCFVFSKSNVKRKNMVDHEKNLFYISRKIVNRLVKQRWASVFFVLTLCTKLLQWIEKILQSVKCNALVRLNQDRGQRIAMHVNRVCVECFISRIHF